MISATSQDVSRTSSRCPGISLRPGGVFLILCLLAWSGPLFAADSSEGDASRFDVLTAEEWQALDTAVDRGLEFLSRTQQPDGSFAAPERGQPGITSLCVMAFLSRGHVPDRGPYGDQLARAIDYVLGTQQPSGLLFDQPINPAWHFGSTNHTAIYNHAIAGLMLGEVYGMTDEAQRVRISAAITSAVRFTRERQLQPKRDQIDHGGWRYLGSLSSLKSDADLSITTWQLMFLRSARNGEFEVPKEAIDDAMGYVRRSFEPAEGAFAYGRKYPGKQVNRAMAGSGILSLSLGGEHQSDMSKSAGAWILRHSFDRYNRVEHHEERYHYSAYYCSQAMFQLGGEYWAHFFPRFQRVLIDNQQADGSWPREANKDGHFGNAYTTALVVLSLTPPYQLLPIYQR